MLPNDNEAEFQAAVLELKQYNKYNYLKVGAGLLLLAIGVGFIFTVLSFIPTF